MGEPTGTWHRSGCRRRGRPEVAPPSRAGAPWPRSREADLVHGRAGRRASGQRRILSRCGFSVRTCDGGLRLGLRLLRLGWNRSPKRRMRRGLHPSGVGPKAETQRIGTALHSERRTTSQNWKRSRTAPWCRISAGQNQARQRKFSASPAEFRIYRFEIQCTGSNSFTASCCRDCATEIPRRGWSFRGRFA